MNSLILKKELDKVLEYLLKKNGQWTDISQKVMDQSSEEMKKVMASRLINKQIKFDKQDENDDIIVQLVASTDNIMQQLWNDMETEQKISLLLEIMTPDQTKIILEELQKGKESTRAERISKFWDSMAKVKRLEVWRNLTNDL